MGGQCHALAALSLGKSPGTHCTGGWVGLGASPDEESLTPTMVWTPNMQKVAVPTTLKKR